VKESNHNLLYFQLQNNEYFYSGVTIVLCSFFINCDLSYLHWMANFKYFVSFKIQNTVIVLFKYIFFTVICIYIQIKFSTQSLVFVF